MNCQGKIGYRAGCF